jgi:hypothetical protein
VKNPARYKQQLLLKYLEPPTLHDGKITAQQQLVTGLLYLSAVCLAVCAAPREVLPLSRSASAVGSQGNWSIKCPSKLLAASFQKHLSYTPACCVFLPACLPACTEPRPGNLLCSGQESRWSVEPLQPASSIRITLRCWPAVFLPACLYLLPYAAPGKCFLCGQEGRWSVVPLQPASSIRLTLLCRPAVFLPACLYLLPCAASWEVLSLWAGVPLVWTAVSIC